MEYGSYKIPWNKRKTVIFLIFLGLFVLFIFVPKEVWGVGKVNIAMLFVLAFIIWLRYSREYIHGETYEWIKKNVKCPVCGGRIIRCEYGGGGDIYTLQCGNCRREFLLRSKFGRSGVVLEDKEEPAVSGAILLVRVLIILALLVVIVAYVLLSLG